MKSFTSVLVSIDSVIRRIVNEAAAVVHDDAVCVDFGCDMSFYFIATERIARQRLDPHNPCFQDLLKRKLNVIWKKDSDMILLIPTVGLSESKTLGNFNSAYFELNVDELPPDFDASKNRPPAAICTHDWTIRLEQTRSNDEAETQIKTCTLCGETRIN